MEGLLLPEQDKKLSDFETGTTQIKCYSQQYPAGFTVYSTHGVIIGDGFFPEVYNLHEERFVNNAQHKELIALPGHTLCQ